ncbi:hypothetical protein QBC39DRAFT_107534 [Podospora conica]|nr:hypothetical protein QBC39DRAFT_107534 [Schizothecium conicum]
MAASDGVGCLLLPPPHTSQACVRLPRPPDLSVSFLIVWCSCRRETTTASALMVCPTTCRRLDAMGEDADTHRAAPYPAMAKQVRPGQLEFCMQRIPPLPARAGLPDCRCTPSRAAEVSSRAYAMPGSSDDDLASGRPAHVPYAASPSCFTLTHARHDVGVACSAVRRRAGTCATETAMVERNPGRSSSDICHPGKHRRDGGAVRDTLHHHETDQGPANRPDTDLPIGPCMPLQAPTAARGVWRR